MLISVLNVDVKQNQKPFGNLAWYTIEIARVFAKPLIEHPLKQQQGRCQQTQQKP